MIVSGPLTVSKLLAVTALRFDDPSIVNGPLMSWTSGIVMVPLAEEEIVTGPLIVSQSLRASASDWEDMFRFPEPASNVLIRPEIIARHQIKLQKEENGRNNIHDSEAKIPVPPNNSPEIDRTCLDFIRAG